METLSQNKSPTPQRPSAKEIPFLWVQLPDIHPTKFHFVKDKLSDWFMFPASGNSPYTEHVKAQSVENKAVS
jgi:hypothetical protein